MEDCGPAGRQKTWGPGPTSYALICDMRRGPPAVYLSLRVCKRLVQACS